MDKSEWKKIARLIGIVYFPIFAFILFVFLLIQYQSIKIEQTKKEIVQPVSTQHQ